MKSFTKIILIAALIGVAKFSSHAQSAVVVRSGNGSGSATPNKRFLKVFRLLNAATKTPVPEASFYLTRDGVVLTGGRTDKKGYAAVMLSQNNYYSKVEIKMGNPSKRSAEPVSKKSQAYLPLKKIIKFPSKKEVVDTIQVLLREAASE